MPLDLQNLVYPINNLRFTEKKRILHIDHLRIKDGEFVGIIDAGEGGASILGKILCGLTKPELGNVSITGADGKQTAESVFFDCECEKTISEISVGKEVCRRIKSTGSKKDEISDKTKAALELVGFEYDAIKNRSPFELSVGDRRKIVLAAAFARRPDLLVLDEPMKDMDGLWCSNLMKLLKTISRNGTTVILLTADTSRLAEYADRILIMKNGGITVDSSAKNVFSEYYGLIHLGLPVPEVRKCCQMLRRQGMDMPNNIILYDQFIDRLKILMWRKNK